jgi:hypothetical protein
MMENVFHACINFQSVFLCNICIVSITVWYVVQFSMDNQLSDPISADDIEDEDGKTGEERTFKVGDSCSAVWRDGINYEGKVLFASGMLCVLMQGFTFLPNV